MDFKERRRAILLAKRQGITNRVLATKYGLSPQRISQIVKWKRPPKKERMRKLLVMGARKNCYICRIWLDNSRGEVKYCEECRRENKLDVGGRDFIRGLVRGRDNNTCQSCGVKWKPGSGKKRHDVHHLDNECGKFSRGYDDITKIHRLITVCHKCHYNLHDHAHHGRQTEAHDVLPKVKNLTSAL